MGVSEMTIKELIKELRKPGKIYMPVLMAGDIEYLAIEKNDLIEVLMAKEADDIAPWNFYGEFANGRKLDVAKE